MLVWFCVLRNFVHTHLMHPCIACPSRCIGYYNFCHHYNLFSIPRPALILAHLYTRKLHRDTSFKADLLTHKTADTFSRTCRNCFIKFSLPFISAVFLCSAIRYHHKRRVCDIFSSRTCGCRSRACRSCFVRGQINLIEHSVTEHGISFRIST